MVGVRGRGERYEFPLVLFLPSERVDFPQKLAGPEICKAGLYRVNGDVWNPILTRQHRAPTEAVAIGNGLQRW